MTAAVVAPRRAAPANESERVMASATATVALIGLTVVTATSFSRVFDGWGFLWPVLLPALGVHMAALVLRRVPGVIALPLTTLVLLCLTAWVFYGNTLSYGFPGGDTISLARDELRAAWEQVGTVVPPVAHEEGFGVAAAVSLGLAAMLADAFAFRGRGAVEAAVPAGVVFVAVAAVGIDRNRVLSTTLWLAASILAAVVLRAMHEVSTEGWIGGRTGGAWVRWVAGGAGLAVFVSVVAALVGPRLPGVGAEPLIDHHNGDGDSVTTAISPLVDVRDRLLNPSNADAFTVTADQPAYWRLTGLPAFDGVSWSLPNSQLRGAGGDLNEDPAYSQPVLQQFLITNLGGVWAPVAYTPTSLQDVAPEDLQLYFVRETSTLVVPDEGLSSNMSYDIVSGVPNPPVDALRSATASSPPSSTYFDLPEGFAARYLDDAQAAVGGASTPYEMALALQNWFRDNFTYSTDVPGSDDGEEIDDFLDRRTGFCVHFSTVYAAFARVLGLPARVATGFTQGERGADGRYIVRMKNAHAWPEVWFDGIGWMLFEPTPGRGAPGAQSYTGVAPEQDTSGPGPVTTAAPGSVPANDFPLITDPFDPNLSIPVTTALGGGVGESPQSGGGTSTGVWLVLALLALFVAWCVMMPRLVAARVHRADSGGQVASMWRALVATANLAGIARADDLTPIEQARTLADAANIDRRDTLELARAATIAIYSPHGVGASHLARSREISVHLLKATRRLLPLHRRALIYIDPRLARRVAGV